MPEEVTNLDNSGVMIFFEEFSHDNGHPITALTDNNFAFLDVLGPGSPLAFGFGLNVVDEHLGGSHGVGIVVDFVANANDRPVISQPCYFLDMVGLDVIGFFVGEAQLILELFD